jgi:NADPH-dependent curcumin reductase
MPNTQVLPASRPNGWPTEASFEIVESAIPSPGEGELLVRSHYLSLDPYMRGRMNDRKSYAAKVEIGQVMIGGAVGEVLESNNAKFKKGDYVVGTFGWQEYALSNGTGIMKVDPKGVPLSAYLGPVGMPGVTAYIGLFDIGGPKPSDTVCVSAASGAVGSVVGQLAKIQGCHVVGIAGGKEKCDYVTRDLGFDVCIDYKVNNLDADLRAAAPKGIDVYFENVGGEVWDAVFPLLNDFARIPVCGLVANYNMTELPPGPDRTAALFRAVLTKRLTIRGFIVWDFAGQAREFATEVGQWLREGKVKYREDVVEGLENAPAAFIGLLKGKNFGKLIVRVAPGSR